MNPNNLDAVKSSDISSANIGDIINYTIVLANNGSVTNNNIILTDLIPQGLNFVNNSIFINNINVQNSNPALGITIPDMPVGAINTVTFQAQMTNIPGDNPMYNWGQVDYQYLDGASLVSASIDTNSVPVSLSPQAILTLTKVAPAAVNIGQNITFTITVNNVGNITANSIRFIDTIPVGTTFVVNSVTVSGVNQGASANPSPPNGFGVSDTGAFSSRTVSFSVKVVSVPSNNFITNVADTSYIFTSNTITGATLPARSSSNITSTTITGVPTLKGITKSVDKKYATCGDILSFTVTIPNTGVISVTNVVLTDTLSNGLTYVSGSLFVNSVPSSDSLTCINVGTISPGGISTVTFKAQINC